MNPTERTVLLNKFSSIRETKAWSSSDLRLALIAIGVLGEYGGLSKHELPTDIHMQMFSKIATDLISLTQQESRRANQAFLVDTENGRLMQGKRTIEQNGEIRVDPTPSSEVSGHQPLIATFRTFNPAVLTYGFNGSVYNSFLTNPSETLMVMLFGVEYRWAVFKSKSTPKLSPEISPAYTISGILKEIGTSHVGQSLKERLDAINGQIAAHYGLQLYRATESSSGTPSDQFTAVNTRQYIDSL